MHSFLSSLNQLVKQHLLAYEETNKVLFSIKLFIHFKTCIIIVKIR
jgi:hypothetical protein